MPRTAAGVVQFTMQGLWSGGTPLASVFHAVLVPAGATDRAGAGVEAAIFMAKAWQTNILPILPDNYVFQGVNYVDLDTAGGATGFHGPDGGLITAGSLTAAAMPPSVSRLARKVLTTGGRGTRPGRLYLPSAVEADVDEDGTITPAHVSAVNTRLDGFVNQVNTSVNGFVSSLKLCTVTWPSESVTINVKRPVASGVGHTNLISRMFLETKIANQRRRVRR